MATLRKILDAALGSLLALLMAASVLNVLWQVLSRYALKSPSTFTEELARFLLIWIGLLGGAYALGKGQHLAIDLLPQTLRGKSKSLLMLAIHVLVLAFAASALLYGGYKLVELSLALGQKSAAMRIPMGYIYLAVPIGGGLMCLYSLLAISDELKNLRSPPDNPEARP